MTLSGVGWCSRMTLRGVGRYDTSRCGPVKVDIQVRGPVKDIQV